MSTENRGQLETLPESNLHVCLRAWEENLSDLSPVLNAVTRAVTVVGAGRHF